MHGDLSDVRRHPPTNKLSSRTFLLSASVALFPFILMMMTMITMMRMMTMMTVRIFMLLMFLMPSSHLY